MKSIPQLAQDITTLFKEIRALKTRINQFSSGGRVSATSVIGTSPSGILYAHTTALTIGWHSFLGRFDNVIQTVAASTYLLPDNTTNYMEVDSAGAISHGASYTLGKIPLGIVTTLAGVITTIVEETAKLDETRLVKVSADDTGPNFLLAKLAAGAGVTLTETNPGADEDVTIGCDADASEITYTPAVAADWDGGLDPGDANDALDQVAERVKDLETIALLTISVLEGWVLDDAQNPTLGALPTNAVVINVDVWVHDAFDSDGTDLLTVGYDGAVDAYVTALDVSAPGVMTPGMGTSVGIVDATPRSVEAYYVNGGSEPTVGKAHIIVQYIIAIAEPA